MLTKLAIWYLKNKKISILIGHELIEGHIKAIHNKTYLYNNILTNVDYRLCNDECFQIPEGKFVNKRNF